MKGHPVVIVDPVPHGAKIHPTHFSVTVFGVREVGSVKIADPVIRTQRQVRHTGTQPLWKKICDPV